MSANPELQEKLRNFIEECGSQTKAAKALGKSAATLSTYLNNRYNGNLSDFEKFLTETFETKAAAENLKSAQVLNSYKPTSISTEVYDTIRLCHLKGGLAIECGDAGIGKTMACKKYAEDYPATAIYVSVNPCLVTLSAFLKLLCRTQKITATGRKDEMWLRLAESKEAFAQIRNRTKLTEVRHTSAIKNSDIELLFPAVKSDERAVSFLLGIARSEQGIRGASNVFGNAVDNGNITYEGLIAMAKAMRIKVF